MRVQLLLLVVLLSLLVDSSFSIKTKPKTAIDPCDSSVIANIEAEADKKIAKEEKRSATEITVTKRNIEDLKRRLAENDPQCRADLLNCESTIRKETALLPSLEQRNARIVAELKEKKARDIALAQRRCAVSKRSTKNTKADLRCDGGRCVCPAGRKLQRFDGAIGTPVPDGCSVPDFLAFGTFNSPFYDDYVHRWHKSACHVHDTCYSTCGKTQRECDEEFGKHLAADCEAVIANLNIPAVLCTWLCKNGDSAKEVLGGGPFNDPEETCTPFVNRKHCNWPMKELLKYTKMDCQRIADLFTMGVTMFGSNAFSDAQREHCECVATKDEL